MLSRVANSVYWLATYIERAENVARFIDVNLHLMLDLPVDDEAQWKPLVMVTGDLDLYLSHYQEVSRENVIDFLTFSPDNLNSILSCLTKARENARSVREVISSEMWAQTNRFYLFVKEAASGKEALENPHDFFHSIKTHSHLFTGLTEVTMSHGEAWHFANIGHHLERADKTSRILDVKYFILLPEEDYVGAPYDNIQWASVLKSASGLEMYRKRFHRIAPRNVSDFLVFDRDFPRAMRYCLIAAENSLHAITGSSVGTFSNQAERRLGKLRADLDYMDIDEVLSDGMHGFLDSFQAKLNLVGNAVFDTFFALKPLPS